MNQGIVNKVSAGEVCSIETAKKLGIFQENIYYKPQYSFLKTYNNELDTSENRNDFKLCTVNTVQNNSSPLCTLTPNAGIGFTTKTGYNKCITAECPPGFNEDENNPSLCKKPTVFKTYSLNERNDERWYDWFTVPNYHLGNKYSSSNEMHFKPCKDNMLPNYAIDPVDKTAKDWTSKDNIGECIDKNIYFAGKYANTTDYCPAAMIKKYGSSRQDLINHYMRLLNTETPTATEIREILELEILIKNSKIENVDIPTNEMATACSKVNTTERLEEVYQICEQLSKNEEAFVGKFVNDPESLRNLRTKLTKYNCHTLFCASKNSIENNATRIDKDPICFEDVGKMQFDKMIEQYNEEKKAKEKELPPITSDISKQEFLTTIKTGFFRIATYFVIFLVIYLIYKYGFRLFEYIYHPVLCTVLNIFRSAGNKQKCKTWKLLQQEELAEEMQDILIKEFRKRKAE